MRLAARDHLVEGRSQAAEIAVATDERRVQAADSTWAHQRECPHEPSGGNSAGLALGLDDDGVVQFECASHGRRRALADQDLAGAGGLLEPGAHVHGITGHEGAALTGATHDHLSGVDADAQGQAVTEEFVQA